jgi:protein O-GlcNAc transferase
MELTIKQALQQGVAAHKEGKLQDAERLYRAILQSQPLHPDANHNLGVLAVSVNKAEAALPLLKTALEANPKIEQFWLSYIDALIKEKQFENAKLVIEQAKTQGVAEEKLNVLETQLTPTAQVNEPKLAMLNKSLSLSQKSKKLSEQKQRKKKAEKQNLKAISPSDTEIKSLLEHYQNGQHDDAEKLAKSITQEFPQHELSWKVLGAIFGQTGRQSEALNATQTAVALSPQDAAAHSNLGITLQKLGRLDEAEASHTQAIALKPDYAEAHYNLGITLQELGRLDEAQASYTQAIALKPDYAEAHSNLGNTLKELERLKEAEASYTQAIALKPNLAEAHYSLGITLQELGRLDEAEASYNKAIELKVDFSEAYSNKNLCLNYSSSSSPLFIFEQHREFGKQFGGLQTEPLLSPRSDVRTENRLRVGYVSGDFRKHSVAYFFEPLLQHHNSNVVETFCYYNNSPVDEMTERLMATSDHWRSIVGITDSDVANLIRNDKIDILVDLSGHTANNRLLVFAQKPAPIQVTWFGYVATTGLSEIDYRFTDLIADPIGEADELHSETLVRLANSDRCYGGNEAFHSNSELPFMRRGHITFGSFNNLTKVTPEVIKVWSNILHAVPKSCLILKAEQVQYGASHYLDCFKQEGIAEDRIKFYKPLPSMEDHLELYNAIDIGLDPFPFNGATTTCEALWMGVPVITLLGDRHVGRVGASILTNVGLTDFIAQDIDGYIQLAVEMAANTNYLQEIREGLRERMQRAPLCDGRSFVSDVESVYQEIWQRYQA